MLHVHVGGHGELLEVQQLGRINRRLAVGRRREPARARTHARTVVRRRTVPGPARAGQAAVAAGSAQRVQ